MKLPKGTFKALAKIIAPLVLLMSVGWFLFPIMIDDLDVPADQSEDVIDIDIAKVRTFSSAMVIICLVLGFILLVYGFTGDEVKDIEFENLAAQSYKCPYCGHELPTKVTQCDNCGHNIPG